MSHQPSLPFTVAPKAAPRLVRPTPFSYSQAMETVVEDVVRVLPELAHVDTSRILVSVTQARQQSKHGVYASCVPLRFAGGSPETRVGKRLYRMPPLLHEGREILYVLYFMLPRFHEEQDYREKLATVIHELYHISPQFNGDIRRFPGKNWAHGSSRETYHQAMRVLADRYLQSSADSEAHAFLKAPFAELLARPGGVVGRFIARPKALLVPDGA
jgi:predicted metallopeptidase